MTKAEAEIERLKTEIEAGGQQRDALRDALVERQKAAISAKARLDEMLSALPTHLRDRSALTAERAKAQSALDARRKAMTHAELAATTAREAAISANKDREAAARTLEACQARHLKAREAFHSRLEQAASQTRIFMPSNPPSRPSMLIAQGSRTIAASSELPRMRRRHRWIASGIKSDRMSRKPRRR